MDSWKLYQSNLNKATEAAVILTYCDYLKVVKKFAYNATNQNRKPWVWANRLAHAVAEIIEMETFLSQILLIILNLSLLPLS